MDFDELYEDDVFWTGADFAQNININTTRSTSFRNREEKFGIVAALSDESKFQPLRLTDVLTIPKREVGKKTMHRKRCNFSAPVKVPNLSKEMMDANLRRNGAFFDYVDDCGEDKEDEMIPPHEIVARGSARNMSFSVLEGAGRTLKGRDLWQVRDAVLRQTGFMD